MNGRRIEKRCMTKHVIRYGIQYFSIGERPCDVVAGVYINTGAGVAGYAELGAEQHIFITHFGNIDAVGGAGGNIGNMRNGRIPGRTVSE